MNASLGSMLDVTPRRILRRLGISAGVAQMPLVPDLPDALHRRFAGGQLKGLRRDYLRERDAAVEELLQRVLSENSLPADLWNRPDLAAFDERIVEYPFTVAWLLEQGMTTSTDIMDVGCVLNHPLMAKHLSSRVGMLWFLNPAVEPLQFESNIAYVIADIRKHDLEGRLRFPSMTCLSVLEHIGMDNTRYGGGPAEFSTPPDHPEQFAIQGARRIVPLLEPGGRLLVSVPFGPFEYLYTFGQVRSPIYYTFDAERLSAFREALARCSVRQWIYKTVPGQGWQTTHEGDAAILPYADQCAGAGGVAFLEITREK